MIREVDDIKKRGQYKNNKFENKRSTTDEYTTERIYNGNKKNTVNKHPVSKTTDVDHITPIDVIEKRYSGLTTEQQKKLANRDYNLALTNSKLNRSKGALENHEYLLRQIKKGEPENLKTTVNMLSKEAGSRTSQRVEATGIMFQNDSKNFVSGVKDNLAGSVVPLASEGIRQMMEVVQGEKEFDEAVKEIGRTALNKVADETQKAAKDILMNKISQSSSMFLKGIKESSNFSKLVCVSEIVKESAIKYLNGEISGEELVEEIGVKGTSMIAGMIGGQVGKEIGKMVGSVVGSLILPGIGTAAGFITGEIVGNVIGTIITSVSCGMIMSFFNDYKNRDRYKLKDKELKMIENAALKEMKIQRDNLKKTIENQYNIWNQEIQSGFDMIITNACEECYSIEDVTGGLDKVLSVFDCSVKFKTKDEYKKQLNKTLVIEL